MQSSRSARRSFRMRPLAAALAFLSFTDPLVHAAHVRAAVPVRSGPSIAVGNCSEGALRNAVAGAPNGATVDLTALSNCTITLAAGEIAIGVDNLTVQGPADASLTLSGNYASRIFHHTGHGVLTLDHLAITKGNYFTHVDDKYTQYAGSGGAVHSDGSVTLSNSSLTNSSVCKDQPTAGYGGGLFAQGDVSVIRSTVSGNIACGAIEPGRSVRSITITTVAQVAAFSRRAISTSHTARPSAATMRWRRVRRRCLRRGQYHHSPQNDHG